MASISKYFRPSRRSKGLELSHEGYESEETRLLREVVEHDRRIEAEQREGRDMFWDRHIDFDELRRYQQSTVPMKGYVYDPELKPKPGTH
jgi:hypothetical protein